MAPSPEDDSGSSQTLPRTAAPDLTEVGPYRILDVLGQGGMGTVYLAEQTEPVRRRVAFKLMNRGKDTERGVARFEAERQALALMDHPSIATVSTAGTTDSGLPFFAMEPVDGAAPAPSTATRNASALAERLELFVPGLRRGPARPPEGGHPPRPQAVQHPGHPGRRRRRCPR